MRDSFDDNYMCVSRAAKLLSETGSPLDIGMLMEISTFLEDSRKYESLDDLIDELSDDPALLRNWFYRAEINVYPSKNKTNEVFRDLLCFCRGSRRLSTVLKKVDYYTDEMAKRYPNKSELKNVVVFTDKWNEKAFERYEATFVQKAKDYNIWFVFYMISDGELKQVPFLHNERNCPDVLEQAKEERRGIVNTNKREIIEYPEEISYSYSGGTWAQNERYTYHFTYCRWCKETYGEDDKRGDVKWSAFKIFVMSLMKIIEENKDALKSDNNSCDDASLRLEIDRDEICSWQISDLENNEALQKLQRAINKFIGKCDKDYLKGEENA